MVTGKLAFKEILRDFTQVFILSALHSTGKNEDTGVKKVVFYVRSEVLTIRASEEEEKETVKEPVVAEQSEVKPVEKKETPASVEPRQEEGRLRYGAQTSRREGEMEERPRERRPLFEM